MILTFVSPLAEILQSQVLLSKGTIILRAWDRSEQKNMDWVSGFAFLPNSALLYFPATYPW